MQGVCSTGAVGIMHYHALSQKRGIVMQCCHVSWTVFIKMLCSTSSGEAVLYTSQCNFKSVKADDASLLLKLSFVSVAFKVKDILPQHLHTSSLRMRVPFNQLTLLLACCLKYAFNAACPVPPTRDEVACASGSATDLKMLPMAGLKDDMLCSNWELMDSAVSGVQQRHTAHEKVCRTNAKATADWHYLLMTCALYASDLRK